MTKILVVEDDYEIASSVREFLKNEGYESIWSSNGYEALEDFRQENIDLIILDIMMPDMDGFAFLKRLRELNDVPVIIISARVATQEKVKGFQLGADDYMTKPFSLAELRARIHYHLKKKQNVERELKDIQFCEGLRYSAESDRFFKDGKKIVFTAKEHGLLLYLIRHPEVVHSKKNLYEAIWVEEDMTGNNTVTVHIKSIREKIGDDLKTPKYIETVWGKGYRFIGDRT